MKKALQPKKIVFIIIGLSLLLAIPITAGLVNMNAGESANLQEDIAYNPNVEYSNKESSNETLGKGKMADPNPSTLGTYPAPPSNQGTMDVLEITEPKLVSTNAGESANLPTEITYYPNISYANIRCCGQTPGEGNWTDPISNTLGFYYGGPNEAEIGVLEITEPRLVNKVEIFGSGCIPPVNLTCNGITQEVQYSHDSSPLGNETLIFDIAPAKIITIYTTQHDDEANHGFGIRYVKLYYVPPIAATLDVDPDTLNFKSKGSWITAYIELPEDYNISDINISTVLLNDTLPAELHPTGIGDHDEDNVTDLMVKFKRADVIEFIANSLVSTERFQTVTLSVTGTLSNETLFEGSDVIRIIYWSDET